MRYISVDWNAKAALYWPAYRRNQALLTNEDLLTQYKEQQTVERGFRFLKDPQFLAATLFLKSVKRIMALTAVMTLCLLVYAALQYRIREALVAEEVAFPNQLGKPISNPTARWIFQCFTGIHVLRINQQQLIVLNINSQHQQVIALLGESYERIYS